MHLDITKTTDLNIYNELINGRLRPFLPENSKLCNIKNLVKAENTRKILKSVDKNNVSKLLDEMDLTIYGYRSLNDIHIEIISSHEGKIADVQIHPRKEYSLKETIDIPPAPDQKSAHFLSLIADEFERIKIRSNKVLESTDSERKLSLYANKHIQKAKQIAYDARFLFNQIQNKGEFINDNADVYILFVLNLFLIRLIVYYQKFFKPFVASCNETEQGLRMDFFYSLPVKFKYPFIFHNINSLSDSVSAVDEPETKDYSIKTIQNNKASDLVSLLSPCKPNRYKSSNAIKKIQWNRGANVLVDALLSLNTNFVYQDQTPMSASTDQIRSLILNNFVDKNGKDFSEETIDTYLKPARSDKLPKSDNPKRIDFSDLFDDKQQEFSQDDS